MTADLPYCQLLPAGWVQVILPDVLTITPLHEPALPVFAPPPPITALPFMEPSP
jgi:hypothetical protein